VQVSDNGLWRLASLTALTSLDLLDCKKVSDEGLCALAGLTTLTRLDLRGCRQVTDNGLGALAGLTSLKAALKAAIEAKCGCYSLYLHGGTVGLLQLSGGTAYQLC
jgi:hypothetical protein